MFKTEFLKMIKTKRFILISIALFLITFPDLIYNWWECVYPPHFVGWEWVTHPCKAAFLSSNSLGHLPQIVINWLLPIILLIMGCDSANQEKKLGVRNITVIRSGREIYLLNKYAISFIVPALMIFIICMLNWTLSIAIFKSGLTFAGLEKHVTEMNEPLLYYQFNHPFSTYFIYILLFCFSVGLCGLMCQALSLLISDIKKVYLLSFIIWLLQLSIHPYLANALQPFTETSLQDTILGILKFAATVFIIVFISILVTRKHKDEI